MTVPQKRVTLCRAISGSAMRVVIAFLTMMGLGASTAMAQDCKPLQLLNKIQMVPDPKGGWRIPVSVNGREKFMGLGLVAATSSITRKTVTELGMPTQKVSLILTALDGTSSNEAARADEFKFGVVEAKYRWFMVAPGPETEDDDDERIGTLSRDMLFGYDVDIDFGTGILSLFAPDHCPDRVGYWVEPPPSTPITFKDFMVSFPIKIENKDFSAILSLGDHSTMTQDVAKAEFDLEPNPAELVPVPNSTSVPPLMGYNHTFSSLSFGGVTVKNLRVMVVQDQLRRARDRTQSTASRALPARSGPNISHLVLGMNILKYLHINISPKTGKLYISAASPPPAK